MLRVIGISTSYFDPTGLAAAKMEVLALRVVIMPALAMETVCCSCGSWINIKRGKGYWDERTMTSWRTLRVASDILSNSSMQHTPPSLRTRAPLQGMSMSFGIAFQAVVVNSPLEDELLRIRIARNISR
jgi:hypothetical protein